MSRRLTNLLLLAFLTGAFLTGWTAFGIGTGWVRLPLVFHAVLGFAVVALIPWKSVIVRHGLKVNTGQAATSLALLLLVVVTIASGLLFSTAGVRSYGPLTAMQVHVGGGTLALVLTLVHARQRPVRPRAIDLERRSLLRAGAVLGAAGAAYVGVSGATTLLRLPGRDSRPTGSYERGSGDPAAMPVTSWLNDGTPSIAVEDWQLRVGGSTYDRDAIAAFEDEITTILDCTGGWYSEQIWSGARLDRLIGDRAGRSIRIRSATGYERRFPIAEASSLLLATHVGGEPLSAGHGAPARLVAPGRRGFWWVKWVNEIVVDDRSWWLQPPFPLT
ncbi:MAG: molybdopterin-dependent oxidoreductase [Acidimicrobiia bacterium]|nr:molybdopterin-dependent oxidoreductase [Acidimicrobiia bacterium]